MNYEQTLRYIHSIPKFIRPLGNAALGRLLHELGDPQSGLNIIHIAGTNGKGSTAAMIASVLQNAGFKTGLFTSPFIERFNERIQINGVQIPDDKLARLSTRVRAVMEEREAFVSEFAFVTAVMFLYFKEEECDYSVIEVGLGGRLDATNIIEKSEVSVITSISLDHMEYLGNTTREIAAEKCGIIKRGGTAVLYPIQDSDVFEVVKNTCRDMDASLFIAAPPKANGDSGFIFPASGGGIYDGITARIGLEGEFQPYNAAAAVEALRCLVRGGAAISAGNIRSGLASVRWMARFERISDRLIIDGGHNADGIRMLMRSLAKLDKKINIVIAMMQDKAVSECVKEIASAAYPVITTQLGMPRCMSAEKLAEEFKNRGAEASVITDPKTAVEESLKKEGMTCVCGSLYLAGEIRKAAGMFTGQ